MTLGRRTSFGWLLIESLFLNHISTLSCYRTSANYLGLLGIYYFSCGYKFNDVATFLLARLVTVCLGSIVVEIKLSSSFGFSMIVLNDRAFLGRFHAFISFSCKFDDLGDSCDNCGGKVAIRFSESDFERLLPSLIESAFTKMAGTTESRKLYLCDCTYDVTDFY